MSAYWDHCGDPLTLGKELGAGGEGSVYALRDRPGFCAKIYRQDKAAARAGKIRAMLDASPSWFLRRGLAWPSAPIYGGPSRAPFAGFLMPMHRDVLELFQLLVPDERMAVAGWLTPRDLCLVAERLAGLVARIHRAGHCIGDLKPQNILVAPLSGRVSLIDTDSFQVRDRKTGKVHRSIVVTPEYTAPELCGVDPGAVDRTPMSDVFALAVLIHQILLCGAHPFEGDLVPGHGASVERVPGRIRRGLCALVPGVSGIRPAAGAVPFTSLHQGLRALFVRTFGPGHEDPKERPSAPEWKKMLSRAAGAMVRCKTNGAHYHDEALAVCPWCERRERTGIDLFPAGQRWQRTVLRVSDRMGAPEDERIEWLRRHVRGRISKGAVTAAERAWLEKTGSALGLDRAGVQRILEERLQQDATWTRLKTLPSRLWAPVARLWAWRRGLSLLKLRLPKLRLPEVRRPVLGPLRRRMLIAAAVLGTGAAGVSLVMGGAGELFAANNPAANERPASAEPLAAPQPPQGSDRTCAAAVPLAAIGNTGGTGAFLRAAPSTSSAKKGLPDGTVVRRTGKTRTANGYVWSEVEVPEGRTGWVVAEYLVDMR